MENFKSQEKRAEYFNSVSKMKQTTRMETRSRKKENISEVDLSRMGRDHLQALNEIYDKILCRQFSLSRQFRFGIEELARIFEVLRSEEDSHSDSLFTSSVAVETVLAKYIAECLSDCSAQMRNTSHILSLLRDYRVVIPLQDGSHTVSLRRLHLILQDNFQDSCLCGLLNIFLAGSMGVTTKVIDF